MNLKEMTERDWFVVQWTDRDEVECPGGNVELWAVRPDMRRSERAVRVRIVVDEPKPHRRRQPSPLTRARERLADVRHILGRLIPGGIPPGCDTVKLAQLVDQHTGCLNAEIEHMSNELRKARAKR